MCHPHPRMTHYPKKMSHRRTLCHQPYPASPRT
jgi:hypothetical protein